MSDVTFDRDEALRFGWRSMKQHMGFFLAWIGIDIVASIVFGGIQLASAQRMPALSFAVNLISTILQLVVAMGVINGALEIVDGKTPRVGDLFTALPRFWSYLGAGFLVGLIMMGGFFLLIIPGIIFGLRYGLAQYAAIEGAGAIEALRVSARLTDGAKLDLLVFGLLAMGVNVLGALCLGVGLLFTVPTTIIAHVWVYRQLKARAAARAVPASAAV